MTKNENKKFQDIFRISYCKCKRWNMSHQDACDIAQLNIINNYIENKRQTLYQTMCDFLRKTYGDNRTYHIYDDEALPTVDYNTPLDDVLKKEVFHINMLDMNYKEKCFVRNLLKRSSTREKMAKYLGVSESRVSQKLTFLYKKITDH